MGFTFLWLLSGVFGGLLLWYDWTTIHNEPFCPTPKAIVRILLGSVLGACMLFAGIIIVVMGDGNRRRDSWWNKPICKKSRS